MKKEGDTSNPGEDNPNNIEDPDDLHQSRVNDDLGEPDADQQKSRSDSSQTNDQNAEMSSGSTPDEVIPPPTN